MNDSLHLVDLFWTIQGEGRYAGHRALFVRMPFCNLTCPWCDTSFDKFHKTSESDFIKLATSEPARLAVVTGGEPTLHKHTPRVIKILKSLGFFVCMESNGTAPPPAGVDFLTVSPKQYSNAKFADAFHIDDQARAQAGEFKYVVEAGFPFSILDRHNDPIDKNARLSLSPEFNRMADSIKEIEAYIQKHPRWVVSLQTHKIMGVP